MGGEERKRRLQDDLRRVLIHQQVVRRTLAASGGSDARATAASVALKQAEQALRAELGGATVTLARTPFIEKKKTKRKRTKASQDQNPAKSRVVCPICAAQLPPSGSDTQLPAHLRADRKHTWCESGREPTAKQRYRALHPLKIEAAPSSGKSVRTVSGGLPTLGKHR